MGKGDRKSKKGKRFLGSYGKTRRRKANKSNILPEQVKPSTEKAPLKDAIEVPSSKPKAKKETAKKSEEKPKKKAPAKAEKKEKEKEEK